MILQDETVTIGGNLFKVMVPMNPRLKKFYELCLNYKSVYIIYREDYNIYIRIFKNGRESEYLNKVRTLEDGSKESSVGVLVKKLKDLNFNQYKGQLLFYK